MVKRIILIGLGLVVLCAGFLAFQLFKPSVKVESGETAYLYIPTGAGLSGVKERLTKGNFIRGNYFNLACRLLKYKKVKPGRYLLKKGMSLANLLKMLRNGQQAEVKIVINKERTRELFAGKIGPGNKFDLECDSLQVIRFLNNNDSLKEFGVDTNTVMAIAMPFTYNIKWNSTPRKLLALFYAAYRKFWTEDRKARADSLHLNPLQVATLASIIEEETNRKEDRYNIASTYLNRLAKGMKLQADPTIKFAVKDFSLKRITGDLLATVSPYNTYLNEGLPPGPICTPSLESLEAVLNAPKTDYLYFVASYKFDGSSIFSSNYDEHIKNARLYQQELTRRMDSVAKAKAGK